MASASLPSISQSPCTSSPTQTDYKAEDLDLFGLPAVLSTDEAQAFREQKAYEEAEYNTQTIGDRWKWRRMSPNAPLSENPDSDLQRRVYECSDCQRVFATNADRQRHKVWIHDWDGQLYCCPIPIAGKCDRRFKRRDNLLEHFKRVHNDTDISNERTSLLDQGKVSSFEREHLYRFRQQDSMLDDLERDHSHKDKSAEGTASQYVKQEKKAAKAAKKELKDTCNKCLTRKKQNKLNLLCQYCQEEVALRTGFLPGSHLPHGKTSIRSSESLKEQSNLSLSPWRKAVLARFMGTNPPDIASRALNSASQSEASDLEMDVDTSETLDLKDPDNSTEQTRNVQARIGELNSDLEWNLSDESSDFDSKEQPQSDIGVASHLSTTPTSLALQPEVRFLTTNTDNEAPGIAPQVVKTEESPIEQRETSCELDSSAVEPAEPVNGKTERIQFVWSIAAGLNLTEPPMAPNKTCIRWTCRCGKRLHDDFKELRPGAAKELEHSLNARSGIHEYANPSRASGNGSTGLGTSSVNNILGSIGQAWRFSRNGFSLPQYHTQNQPCQAAQNSSQRLPDSLYLLLCIPYKKRATKLLHLNVCTVMSDQLLFPILKDNYHHMRGKWSCALSLKSLRTIQFVQFEMYKSELVDIRKVDDIPLEDRLNEYRYRPRPPDLIPPVGENHLMHLYEHPHDAEATAICLDRFPKKLRERLLVCPSRGTGLGWGIHFVEGWHLGKIWLLAFAVVLGSLLFGICWAVLKHDLQGAFGVSCYMLAFLALTAGSVQAAAELN
ncbi:MAG: hypothetical protein M1836_000337 [Candelina mexicana]|nr:MAG: hypothetical protein M1836_000337 [Candelina mexicana]